MTQLTPARAVAMQKRGMTATAIGRELGVSRQQVHYWFRAMQYDPWVYHGCTIAEMYAEGRPVSAIEDVVGISLSGGGSAVRLGELLAERGVPRRYAVAERAYPQPMPDALVCNRCEILLDAERESGMCTDCERELVSGRLAMAPTEFTLMAEAMEGVR